MRTVIVIAILVFAVVIATWWTQPVVSPNRSGESVTDGLERVGDDSVMDASHVPTVERLSPLPTEIVFQKGPIAKSICQIHVQSSDSSDPLSGVALFVCNGKEKELSSGVITDLLGNAYLSIEPVPTAIVAYKAGWLRTFADVLPAVNPNIIRLSMGNTLDVYLVVPSDETLPQKIDIAVEPNSIELDSSGNPRYLYSSFTSSSNVVRVSLEQGTRVAQCSSRVEKGKVHISGLESGTYALTVWAPGYRLEPNRWPALQLEIPSPAVEVRLQKSAMIHVFVRRPAALEAIGECNVGMEWDQVFTKDILYFPADTISDSEYTFGTSGAIPDGVVRIRVKSDGCCDWISDIVTVQGATALPSTIEAILTLAPALDVVAETRGGERVDVREVGLMASQGAASRWEQVRHRRSRSSSVYYLADRMRVCAANSGESSLNLFVVSKLHGDGVLSWKVGPTEVQTIVTLSGVDERDYELMTVSRSSLTAIRVYRVVEGSSILVGGSTDAMEGVCDAGVRIEGNHVGGLAADREYVIEGLDTVRTKRVRWQGTPNTIAGPIVLREN